MEKVYDLDVRGYDIETPKGGFLFIDKDFKTEEYRVFRIDRFKNELEALVYYLLNDKPQYYCGFNNVKFDAQVIQWILDNHHLWFDLGGEEIALRIAQFASDVIDDINHDIWPPYREEQLWCKQIDLRLIHHFDNKARLCSLKWLEFSMDMVNIEDMPHDYRIRYFTEQQILEMIGYCKTDNDANEALYWITRGITENDEYKGKDKIRDRLDIIEELNFPLRAMNFSDVKIGDELNKRAYCKRAGIDQNRLYELKQNRVSTAGFTFGDCIPDYVSFETQEFQEFFEKMKGEVVNLNKKDDDDEGYPFTYNGTIYKIANGGIHSCEKKRRLIIEDDMDMSDADVGSQYPRAINKRHIYPSHLGPLWNEGYEENTEIRIEFKHKGANKKDPLWRKWKGLSDMYKLALNGGGFGKLNERTNWQYDAFAMHKCTIGNQFEILMLIEMLELEDIHCVSANTDGIVCLFKSTLKNKYLELCQKWERKVGNDVHGKLEYADYRRLIQTSVNSYIAVKNDGSVKKKGLFLTSTELHKNKSRRIIPIAMEKYFTEDIPVEETIRNHTNVWDFVIGTKGNDDYYYKTCNTKTGEETILTSKVIRYLVTKDGKKLLKIKRDTSDKPGPEISNKEKGNYLCTVYNNAVEKDVSKLNINYDYYITKTMEIIEGIENPKRKKIYRNPDQISLF
jgi:hypothetical protein